MFQAGYLAIESLRRSPGQLYVTLRYSNLEVRSRLNSALLQAWCDDPARCGVHLPQLYDRLLSNDFIDLQQLFNAFFASTPND